ncbi:MAG: cellulase family glycosylhydrolase [Paludibacteraceae bacterium]|nr:cellulase family glycosylhydrolase [Paludibacteraceae bacterium]
MKNTLRKGCLGALFFMSAVSGFSQIKVQAEDYVEAKSGGTEIATENGGATVGFFDEMGETMTYEVNIPKEGLYQISFKYLSGKDGSLRIETADGAYAIYQTKAYQSSGNWWELPLNDWPMFPMDESALFYFKEGKQKFKAVNRNTGLNLDYFELQQSSSTDTKVATIKTNVSKLTLTPYDKQEILVSTYNASNELLAVKCTWSSNVKNGVYEAGASETTDIVTVSVDGVEKDINVKVVKPTKKKEFVVSKHGNLNTKDGAVRDQSGNKVSLMGPSFFWSCSAPQWWKKETVDYLVSKFNVQIVRLPISIAPGDNTWENHSATWNTDNYLHSPDYTRALVDEVVKAAIENDIYVIIDFHEHHAEHWVDLANDFFTYFAKKWGEYPNVMYEIYNEPMTDNGTVVQYAKKVIPTIRNIDPDNVIIVGSTQYSREPDNVTEAGQGYSNIAYTWHGYVEWDHQYDWNGKSSWNNGVPIVVTEWGLNWSKNDGGLLNIYRERSLINCFWSMCNKGGDDAKWSILKDGCYKTSDWSDSDMTENGAYLLSVAQSWVNYKPVVLSVDPDDLTLSLSPDKVIYLPENEVSLVADAAGGLGSYTYKWTISSGGDGATLSSDNAAKTKLTVTKAGTYIVSVSVTDGEDEQSGTVKIVVYPEGWVDPGLIDDISDNDIISRLGGKWDSYDDSKQVANRHSSITSAEKLPSDGVIKAEFTMGDRWQGDGWTSDPYCGVRLSMRGDGEPMDLSSCSKISYRYKGAAHSFRVEMGSQKDDDFYSYSVSEASDWKTASISWGSMKQDPTWGDDVELDKTDIVKFSWQLKGEIGSGSLLIDDVTCEGGQFLVSSSDALAENATMSIYPNPAENGRCQLLVSERTKIDVFSATGCLVKSFVALPFFDNEIQFPASGVYLVKSATSVIRVIVK